MRSVLLLALALAGLSLPPAAGLSAQTAADSAGIARALALYLDEDVLPELSGPYDVLVGEPTTRFDTLVAAELEALPPFQRPVRDSAGAVRIATRGLTQLRGRPAVLVSVSACVPSSHWGGGHWWINQTYYVLSQTEHGWEVIGAQTLDNADGTCTATPPSGSGP